MVVRLASRLAATAAFIIGASGCTSTPPASPELMAHCQKLQMLWVRYEPVLTLFHTGQKARVELAMMDCQAGRYEEGIRELEKILKHCKIPIPPR
ncbi:MAG: hypothetical protein EPO55_05610 [Reyranella sp.]|uniref:hypothetical protein n=1 Tax=Reyranella sp. TaxID=1929291 RepID=UPI0011FFA5F3|nr:hypothetical protein [Reyranella sp.]TAJ41410.1 MAG: hypothetical protein EPO55_05610 [Reyranella sp.]